MRGQGNSIKENIIILVLLGLEAWFVLLNRYCIEQIGYYITGGYMLLLIMYPLSKKHKAGISKREEYLTIFARWGVLNIAVGLLLYENRMEEAPVLHLIRIGILIAAGGISLYIVLAVHRLFMRLAGKTARKGMLIYSSNDAEYLETDESLWNDILPENRVDRYYYSDGMPLYGFAKIIKEYDRIYILDLPSGIRNDILKICFRNQVSVYCLSKISDIMIQSAGNSKMNDKPLFVCDKYRLDSGEELVKRIFDILFSVIIMLILAPLYALIAICIKLEDGGTVIYRQTRCTKDGREFCLYKFRSMIENAEPDGPRLSVAGDDRITRIGRFLRNTKLDELPQFYNILRGDMSVVGPRPERPELIREIVKKVPEFEFRQNVKAGLTGYAQVQGNYISTPLDKLKWDLMYIHQYSFGLDLKIIAMTPFVLFIRGNKEA